MLEVDLAPWQEWLLVHALELDEEGFFRFRTVIVIVARQNGKSTLSKVLALFCMYILGVALVLGTAQDLDVAEEIWADCVEIVEETPALDDLKKKVVQTNGKKALILRSGSRYKVKATNRRAGRGLSGDLIMLDELREHQSWDAWAAITKTTMAREEALTFGLSNAGDAASLVLRYLRKIAHKSLGDPDGFAAADDPELLLASAAPKVSEEIEEANASLAIFEWSAPPEADVWDRDAWAQANPSLGYFIAESTIAAAAAQDPESIFRPEVLGQWSNGSLDGPFPAGKWEGGIDAESAFDPDSRLVAAVDLSWDRSRASIAVAGHRPDGLPMVEIIAASTGSEWVVPWLTERMPKHGIESVAVQTGAPAETLIEELEEAGITVIPLGGRDVGIACGQFYDLVVGDEPDSPEPGDLRHIPQPVLDVAASTAVTRPMGDQWAWDRKKSPLDASPLMAATGAVWGLGRPVEKPKRSRYEDPDAALVF